MPISFTELQSSAPSAIIELYELQLDSQIHNSTTIYRFHAGVNAVGTNADIVWAGNTYQQLPIEAEGFEYTGNNQLPRPKLRVSNILGTITALITATPLEGAKVTRIRTMARYLDTANFPSRRNLLTTTSDFSGTWLHGASLSSYFTATPSNVYAPDGTISAMQFVSTSTTAQGLFLRASQSFTAATYTTSLYVYVPSQTGVTSWGLVLDAADSANTATSAAQTLFDQWVRVSLPITYTATRAFLDFNIRRNGSAPTAAGFTFHAWGAQHETGTTLTDYQPVTATWSQNPYGAPDPTAEFPREIYYIDRKSVETRDVVEFELAAAFDLVNVRAPKRQCISNICQWKYKSSECGYDPTSPAATPLRQHYISTGYGAGRNINSTGQFNGTYYIATHADVAAAGYTSGTAYQHYLAYGIWEGRAANSGGAFNTTYYLNTYTDLNTIVYFNENDVGVSSVALDVCGKRLSSCKIRFGPAAALPFGSFPGVGTYIG